MTSKVNNKSIEKRKTIHIKNFYVKDFLISIFGLSLYVLGIRGFIAPNEIVTGGLMGVALIINYATSIPIWIPYIIINSFLVILAWKIVGGRFVANSIVSIIILTLFLNLSDMFPSDVALVETDRLMSGIIGGTLAGIGLGLNISVNSSTGGFDFIAAIVTKYRRISMGRALMIADTIVIASSFFLKGGSIETVIFGLIITVVMYYFVDLVINGYSQSMQFVIFSQKYEQIATNINAEIQRGCTIFDCQGWYSKTPNKAIYVIAKRSDSALVFRIVKTIDENAFIVQNEVNKVYGLGFEKIR